MHTLTNQVAEKWTVLGQRMSASPVRIGGNAEEMMGTCMFPSSSECHFPQAMAMSLKPCDCLGDPLA
jgi:hypothetical protein